MNGKFFVLLLSAFLSAGAATGRLGADNAAAASTHLVHRIMAAIGGQ
jgi:hypothetical protein